MISNGDELEAAFTFETETRGIVEEPPFHMLILGDWSSEGEKKNLEHRKPIEIDRDNFDEVLLSIGPEITLDLNGLDLRLVFRDLDDFHPDRIFERVSLFSGLRGLRERLRNKDTFNEASREVRSMFGEDDASSVPEVSLAQTNTQDQPEDLLGQILSGRSQRESSGQNQNNTALGGLINELVRPYLVSIDHDEQKQMIEAVDRATGDLMRTILHDRKFKDIEAAWRALFFLVRRTETNAELKLFILDISKSELSGDLKSADNLAETVVYKKLKADLPANMPWAAIIGDYGFMPSVDDIAALIRISQICSSSGVPFISHMRPELLGIKTLDGNTDPRSWNLSGANDAGRLWSTLRSMPESRYLGMTIPRFLGRLPYGSECEPLESFAFEEFERSAEHDDYLWINSAFACALLLAQTYSANGWDMSGKFIQDIDNLPFYTYRSADETLFLPCAEVQLSHDGADKLMSHGLMPVVSYKNTDTVRLERLQSITEPVTSLGGRWADPK